ncbi:hypothetical protein RRG08_005325 [Elysia crispata]|uniref:Uncharacterized protein n=1 Tax=Elysia crispata TaxID=231223 RepID=A0AAE0Z0U5_9GAST|nr:hypothetical protein RRG08_005325 [Elysia crispata]
MGAHSETNNLPAPVPVAKQAMFPPWEPTVRQPTSHCSCSKASHVSTMVVHSESNDLPAPVPVAKQAMFPPWEPTVRQTTYQPLLL